MLFLPPEQDPVQDQMSHFIVTSLSFPLTWNIFTAFVCVCVHGDFLYDINIFEEYKFFKISFFY